MSLMPANIIRPAYKCAGFLLLGLGIAGLILPVMPGTIFLILSLACFTRSDPKMESWMLNHPKMGPGLRDWRETGSIRPWLKVFISSVILIAVGSSARVIPSVAGQIAWYLIGLAGVLYVCTRPNKR
ncbi:MAG: YbaN family protein [Armatimonadetes bacterium]|nr:YbaN family protein [Armatimonadota bacterium]